MMKHKRVLALVLTVALCVGALASAASAADTDAQSQSTEKTVPEDGQQKQRRTQDEAAAQDGEAGTRTRKAKKEEAAEPEGAVGKDAARAKALSDAGLTEDQVGKIRVRVSESDGTAVYKVRFRYDGQRYSYQIDAMSGEILQKKSEAAEEKTRTGGRGKGTAQAESRDAAV